MSINTNYPDILNRQEVGREFRKRSIFRQNLLKEVLKFQKMLTQTTGINLLDPCKAGEEPELCAIFNKHKVVTLLRSGRFFLSLTREEQLALPDKLHNIQYNTPPHYFLPFSFQPPIESSQDRKTAHRRSTAVPKQTKKTSAPPPSQRLIDQRSQKTK